jgi:Na+-driven multidrug efflux pump
MLFLQKDGQTVRENLPPKKTHASKAACVAMSKAALVREEIRILFRLSMPIVATSFLSYSMHIVDLSFVGHLGKSELAAAALGHMLFSAIVYPMMDVTSALETYMSQVCKHPHGSPI